MTMIVEGALLELWERVVGATPEERHQALLGEPPPQSLGARNAALLRLRSQLFGSMQPLRCACGICGATVEFTIDCDALARAVLPAADASGDHMLDVDGVHLTFHVPTSEDVQDAMDRGHHRTSFVSRLFRRCVTRCERDGVPCAPDDLPAGAIEALSRSMEALEPGAVVAFELRCPDCGRMWTSAMDCVAVLWSELQARAERLLLDVDALARVYGWNEAEVLSLSRIRRAAYLELVGAT